VHEERPLRYVAGLPWVETDIERQLPFCVFIHIDGAHPFVMLQHRHPRLLGHASDQTSPPRGMTRSMLSVILSSS
jgi:hypothetical protein